MKRPINACHALLTGMSAMIALRHNFRLSADDVYKNVPDKKPVCK